MEPQIGIQGKRCGRSARQTRSGSFNGAPDWYLGKDDKRTAPLSRVTGFNGAPDWYLGKGLGLGYCLQHGWSFNGAPDWYLGKDDASRNLTDPLKFFRRDIGYSRARSFEVLAC